MYKRQVLGPNKRATTAPVMRSWSKTGKKRKFAQLCVGCRNINESPIQTYQAQKIAQLFKGVLQKQPEEEELLQPKFTLQEQAEHASTQRGPAGQGANPINSPAMNSGIPGGLLNKMESSFGRDLSSVTVHSNSNKATEVGALAFTQGTDIHFAPGQFNPTTSTGRKLLGHEMTHVVQQAEGRVMPTGEVAGLPLNDNPSLEQEADKQAGRF